VTSQTTQAGSGTSPGGRSVLARGRPGTSRRRIARRHLLTRKETVGYGIAGLVVLLLLWQIADWAGLINPLVWSSPERVVQSFQSSVSHGVLLPALASTSELFGIGFGLSLVIGIPCGMILGWYRRVNAFFDPIVSLSYALPRIALIPLVVIWFGPGLAARVTVVVLLAAFPIMINVASGIATVSEDHIRLARSFLATNTDVLRMIALPGAVPAIISGIRQGLNLGLAGVVVAEYFIGVTGVGGLIFNAGLTLDTSQAIVGALVFAIGGLILTALLQIIEHRLDRWRA
jgi:ABC-type nitrate/sulfonate/bicarbonate transport system permease component